eukprot:TRINITY_DN16812_c0_g1_i1.p1 TRINITY_DN16812_c0_g1~~TRINITY_DN16812_c0_g1_i1.p1  ORF type:complete len:201 (+),score=31.69 TRINITY_DN16812_c0_g1_i1:165-767(+)
MSTAVIASLRRSRLLSLNSSCRSSVCAGGCLVQSRSPSQRRHQQMWLPPAQGMHNERLGLFRRGMSGYAMSNLDIFDPTAENAYKQTRIEETSETGFNVNGVNFSGPIICFPESVYCWLVKDVRDITAESLAMTTVLSPAIKTLIIGTGRTAMPPDYKLIAAMKEHGIVVESMTTANAVGTFNFLRQEERPVAAALLPGT